MLIFHLTVSTFMIKGPDSREILIICEFLIWSFSNKFGVSVIDFNLNWSLRLAFTWL